MAITSPVQAGAGRYPGNETRHTYTRTHKNRQAAGAAAVYFNFPFISLLQQQTMNDSNAEQPIGTVL